jgi:multisubunit Na+/H+ antiporter MnhC subunit
MASTQSQKVPCPVCHQADQVRKVPTAYESGVARLAPPAMPVAHVRMLPYIVIGFALVSVGVFIVLVWSGTNGYATWPVAVQIVQVTLTILAIVAALVISLWAFLRVVQGDLKTQKYLPAYDRAMEKWSSLYYCKRDDVVFDPQSNKTISDAAFRSMISIEANEEPEAHTPSATLAPQ